MICGVSTRGGIMSVAVIGAKLGSYLPFLLLTISILIGVPVAYRYYREVREDDEPIRDADLLADLEQGDAASKMTEAEFRRVRDLLNGCRNAARRETRAKPPGPSRSGRRHSTRKSQSEIPSPRRPDRSNRPDSGENPIVTDQGLRARGRPTDFRTSAAGARPSVRD